MVAGYRGMQDGETGRCVSISAPTGCETGARSIRPDFAPPPPHEFARRRMTHYSDELAQRVGVLFRR